MAHEAKSSDATIAGSCALPRRAITDEPRRDAGTSIAANSIIESMLRVELLLPSFENQSADGHGIGPHLRFRSLIPTIATR
jgi:hypothetical protein